MTNSLEMLGQNKDFVLGAYNLQGIMGLLIVLALVDVALKGWAMWRAAKMNKRYWFIILLIANTIGLLPSIFLLFTRDEYAKLSAGSTKKS